MASSGACPEVASGVAASQWQVGDLGPLVWGTCLWEGVSDAEHCLDPSIC